jgi:hypothetical protein
MLACSIEFRLGRSSAGNTHNQNQEKVMHRSTVVALASAALFGAAAPAYAFFEVDSNPNNYQKLFLDEAKNITSFSGTVGANNSGPVVGITTDGAVDVSSGFATIKPIKGGELDSLVFTPQDPTLFRGFSFRGQLDEGSTVKLTVLDNQGNPAQDFIFPVQNTNENFGPFAVISNDGETIKSIKLSGAFKEQKQTEFLRAVPEPETYAMLGFGLALIGIGARRRIF